MNERKRRHMLILPFKITHTRDERLDTVEEIALFL